MRFKVYEYDIPCVCYIRPQTWKRPSAKDYADVDPSNLIGEVEICNNDIRFTYDPSIIAPKSQMKSLICLFDPKDVQDMKITDEIKMDVLEASKFIEIEPSETPKHIYVNLMCGDQEIVYEDRRYVVGMSHSLITDEPLQRMVTKQGESPLPVVPIFIATNKEKAPSLETKFTDEKSISVSNGDQKKEDDSDSEIELYAYGRRGSGVITVPDASKFVKIEPPKTPKHTKEESDSDDTDKYDDDDDDDDEDDDDDSGSEDMSKEDSLHQARIRTLLILTASHLGKRKAAINCNNKTAKMMKYEEEEEEEDE